MDQEQSGSELGKKWDPYIVNNYVLNSLKKSFLEFSGTKEDFITALREFSQENGLVLGFRRDDDPLFSDDHDGAVEVNVEGSLYGLLVRSGELCVYECMEIGGEKKWIRAGVRSLCGPS